MADRTSARLFGKFFSMLARNPSKENKKLANELYDDLSQYDFSLYQMGVDDSLIELGLAYLGVTQIIQKTGK